MPVVAHGLGHRDGLIELLHDADVHLGGAQQRIEVSGGLIEFSGGGVDGGISVRVSPAVDRLYGEFLCCGLEFDCWAHYGGLFRTGAQVVDRLQL